MQAAKKGMATKEMKQATRPKPPVDPIDPSRVPARPRSGTQAQIRLSPCPRRQTPAATCHEAPPPHTPTQTTVKVEATPARAGASATEPLHRGEGGRPGKDLRVKENHRRRHRAGFARRLTASAEGERDWRGRRAPSFTVDHMEQYIRLWELVSNVNLTPGTDDSVVWTLTLNGCYSAKSAYKAQFMAALPCPFGNIVWKTWAPPKCRFFAWLAVQNRLWTADRLAKRGWPHPTTCQLCRCCPETARHLLFESRFSKRIWMAAASWLSCPDLIRCLGTGRPKVLEYWQAIARTPTSSTKGLRTAIVLIA
ncbi:hypothetical protein QYE76_070148 [Lolium multiflorum]|uniref:Reverse transcriptase zinc-binding domain-containing protein n=1 Tax=Lolium multiflorum TaxID=4521 RepID=A0AAD8SIT7_LOLMU|nr:hypothetical protein QYE76_070148 [Lolium multiflorum]